MKRRNEQVLVNWAVIIFCLAFWYGMYLLFFSG